METLGMIIVGLLIIVAFTLGSWVLKTTFAGAVNMLETAGPIVFIGWIFAFPLMLIGAFVWGLDMDSKQREKNTLTAERWSREREVASANFTEYCLNKVIAYESKTSEDLRSKHSFNLYVTSYANRDFNSFNHIWNLSINSSRKAEFLAALEYPEFIEKDLNNAVAKARTKEAFLENNKEMTTFFDGKYPINPEWLRNEQSDERKLRKLEAEEARKRELRAKLPKA
jgi:hypothetical protein